MSKPTNFNTSESLEIVWEAIDQWSIDFEQDEFKNEHYPQKDDVKLAMNWIMDELKYDYDAHGYIVKKIETS